jgi:hypothetical protein
MGPCTGIDPKKERSVGKTTEGSAHAKKKKGEYQMEWYGKEVYSKAGMGAMISCSRMKRGPVHSPSDQQYQQMG